MIYIGLLICALFCIRNLTFNFNPILSYRKILIQTEFSNTDASQIKEMVTTPIENACVVIPGHKNISSISIDGISLVQIEFHYGTDIDIAFLKTKEILDSVYESLPYGCKKSCIEIIKPENDFFIFSLSSDTTENSNIRFYAENILIPDLLRIKGIENISLIGGDIEEIQILLDRNKLQQRKLSMNDVATAYNLSNCEYPIGTINDGENLIQVKLNGLLESAEKIENIIVKHNIDSGTIRIRDLGMVKKNNALQKNFATVDDSECVLLSVQYCNTENPIKISKNINERLKKLNEINNYKIRIHQDASITLKNDVKVLFLQGIIGTIVTFIALTIFFKSITIGTIVTSTVPVCLIFSLAILTITNNTLNRISISGLTLGIGLIVDCSSVVAERIFSNKNIIKGAKSIKNSNIGSTLTTVLAFIPIFFTVGALKEIFSCLSITIISCISFSYIASCSLTIALLKIFYNKTKIKIKNYTILERVYKKLLLKVLNKPIYFIIIILIILFISFFLFSFMKFNFSTNNKTEQVYITMNFPSNVRSDHIKELSHDYFEKINKIPSVKEIVITGGTFNSVEEFSTKSFYKNKLIIHIYLEKTKISKLNKELKKHFDFSKLYICYGKNNLNEIFNNPLGNFILCAENSYNIKNELNCDVLPEETSNEWEFKPCYEKLSNCDVSTEYILNEISNYINGIDFSPFTNEDRKYPCKIKIDNKNNFDVIETFNSIYINVNQKPVPISSLGNLYKTNKEKIFFRYERKDAKVLCIDKTQIKLYKNDKFNNYSILDTQKETINNFTKESILLISLVCILIFIIIGILFESFSIPFIVCFSIFLAIPGAIIALFFSRFEFDYNAMISIIILLGLSANNSILLMEKIVDAKKIDKLTIINESTCVLRTLIITNGTTIFSLIPFVTTSSISVSIIGGLIVSTFINVFLIPLFAVIFRNNILKI